MIGWREMCRNSILRGEMAGRAGHQGGD